MPQLAPPDVMKGALQVLYVAAYTTRNWTLNETISRKQINDLWEAIHEIPRALVDWCGVENFEDNLNRDFSGYARKWKTPDLLAIYKQAKEASDV